MVLNGYNLKFCGDLFKISQYWEKLPARDRDQRIPEEEFVFLF